MVTEILIEKIISGGDVISEGLYRKTRSFLPFIARLCLLSHFYQENYIVFHHRQHILGIFGTSNWVIAVMFVTCFLARTLGFVMALFKIKAPLACGLLFSSGVVQMFFTYMLPDIPRLLVRVSLFGSLFFLLAESLSEKSTQAGAPALDIYEIQDYFKLVGRCLLVIMFVNFISLETSFRVLLQDFIGLAMMILVIFGYRTKFTVLIAVLYVNIFNFDDNDWWTIKDDPHKRMLVQHKFLEGISVTGGLLMLVLHGPGEISIDRRNKSW